MAVQQGNDKRIPFYQSRGFKEQGLRSGYGNGADDPYLSIRFVRSIL
ncbi:hypothetical protein [Halobacillus mangrovi]